MPIGIRILSNNLSGQTTDVTFLPLSGGTVNLGTQVFPFNYLSGYIYGTYNCYVPTYGYTYSLEVPEPTPTPTPTTTPIPTCLDGWMTENFNGTTFRNGDIIPQAINSTEWADANTNQTPAWCYYNFDFDIGIIYGKLYNWYVVEDSRGIGSVGYIVPSESDWDTFEICLGGNSIAGGKLKTTGTIEDNNGLWYAPNAGATNEIGFSGVPSGIMSDGGFPALLNERASFWTTTEIGGSVMVMNLNYGRTDVYHGPDSKGKGYSIRLKQGISPTGSTPTPTVTSTNIN